MVCRAEGSEGKTPLGGAIDRNRDNFDIAALVVLARASADSSTSSPFAANRRLMMRLSTSAQLVWWLRSTRSPAGLHRCHDSVRPCRSCPIKTGSGPRSRSFNSKVAPSRRFTPTSTLGCSSIRYTSQRSSTTPAVPSLVNQVRTSAGNGPSKNQRASVVRSTVAAPDSLCDGDATESISEPATCLMSISFVHLSLTCVIDRSRAVRHLDSGRRCG